MASIKIDELQSLKFEFEELSDLELESVVGGKCSSESVVGREPADSPVYKGA